MVQRPLHQGNKNPGRACLDNLGIDMSLKEWKNRIVCGHAPRVLKQMPDEIVQCCVTSPPYWGLRTYGTEKWEGGDSNCDHVADPKATKKFGNPEFNVNRPSREETKTAGYYKDICPKCGAVRIDPQLGLEKTVEEYIAKMVEVFREVKRVLRKDGTLWLNMGDSYASGKGSCFNPGGGESSYKDYRKEAGVIPLERLNVSEVRAAGLKPKDLCGIPWRLAFALQADGWYLRSDVIELVELYCPRCGWVLEERIWRFGQDRDIIWAKPNPMPESVTDRPTKSHEYIFFLTKSGTSQYWTHREKDGVRSKPKADWRWVNQITGEEVAEAPPDWKEIITCPKCGGKGVAQVDCGYEIMGEWFESWQEDECPVCKGKKNIQRWKRVNLWHGHDYFYDQEAVREKYEKPLDRWGGATTKETDYSKGNEFAIKERVGREHRPNPSGRNLRSVWTFPTRGFKDAHFATFPPELPRRCILAGTSEKGCCPDCGAPWERVTERSGGRDWRQDKIEPKGIPGEIMGEGGSKRGQSSTPLNDTQKVQTLGWRPTCSCSHKETVPCVVLDPFLGRGTTAEVAIELGRDYIGIDLNPDYIEELAKPAIERATYEREQRLAQEELFNRDPIH